MITYDEVISLVKRCSVALRGYENCELSDLRREYKNTTNDQQRKDIDNLIWVKEFHKKYANKEKTAIDCDISQPCFEDYIKSVQQALDNLDCE